MTPNEYRYFRCQEEAIAAFRDFYLGLNPVEKADMRDWLEKAEELPGAIVVEFNLRDLPDDWAQLDLPPGDLRKALNAWDAGEAFIGEPG